MWTDRSEVLKGFLLRVWSGLPLTFRMRSALYWVLGTKYAVGVQAVVIDRQGRLLLLQHTYKGRYPWGLPGGGLSRGETTVQAAVRETREEAGLAVQVVRLLGVETHPSRLLIEVFYLCRAGGGQFRPNAEIADYGFFDLAHLPPAMEPRLLGIIGRYAAAGDLAATGR